MRGPSKVILGTNEIVTKSVSKPTRKVSKKARRWISVGFVCSCAKRYHELPLTLDRHGELLPSGEHPEIQGLEGVVKAERSSLSNASAVSKDEEINVHVDEFLEDVDLDMDEKVSVKVNDFKSG